MDNSTLSVLCLSRVKVNIVQSDTDSDSGANVPEFIVATSVGREALGTSLRVGDKVSKIARQTHHFLHFTRRASIKI